MVFEGLVVDAVIDECPRKASMPERHFAMSQAVLQEDAGIEHEGMKDHEDIERRQHGGLPS